MEQAVDFIKSRIGEFSPRVGIILGSGLGELADIYNEISIPYAEIPGFKMSTVSGHKGQLVFAKINKVPVVMMQGRFHFYEGHSLETVVYPVKVMKKLGVEKLIVTNAAGGLNKKFKPADLMVITDHINMLGTNPLIGPNDDSLGTRFPDMTSVYSKNLIKIADDCAKKLKIKLQKGVYVAMTGPSYETPSEVRMLQTLGGDAVGMSTVPECIVANYCKMEVLGISCICNSAAGVSKTQLSHAEVIEAANQAKDKFKALVLSVLEEIGRN